MKRSRKGSWLHGPVCVWVRKIYWLLRRVFPSLFGCLALVCGLIAGIMTWVLAVPPEDIDFPFGLTPRWIAFLGIVSASLAGIFSWIDKKKARANERRDLDGLTAALEKVLPLLHEVANESPDSPYAKRYVGIVLDSLRERLEPSSRDDTVRVNLYRRDQQEETGATGGGVMRFDLYACSQGGRTDVARKVFQDDEAPGKHFMSVLKDKARFVVTNRSELYSDDVQHPSTEPSYGSFVNLALRGNDGEPFAMLTADSVHEFYFSTSQERLMRAFQQLIELALTYSTKESDVPKPFGLNIEKGR